MKLYFLLLPLILSAGVAAQQKPLHNEDILKMVQAGLGADPILTMISTVTCEFDTSPDALIRLKQGGVPDNVITAMVSKARQPVTPAGGPAAGIAGPAPTTGVNDTRLVEVGVYYIQSKGGELIFMEPEVVTWKSGGVLKTVATAGITKGHVNGVVKGPSSRYSLKGDEQMFIYCPEGVSGAEYQLLRLWEKENRREFRALTGGIIHASGGADENAIAFQPVRVSPRIYKLQLPTLTAGEYGLLPPGAVSSSNAASVGKIYSFTVGK
jgi:hypothetical protein